MQTLLINDDQQQTQIDSTMASLHFVNMVRRLLSTVSPSALCLANFDSFHHLRSYLLQPRSTSSSTTKPSASWINGDLGYTKPVVLWTQSETEILMLKKQL
jgi:hypothetical protein